jgi:hypothetical protein
MRFRLTVEADDVDQLLAIARAINATGAAAATHVDRQAPPMPMADPPAAINQCPMGHGEMRLIVPKAGGKQFPPFLKCDNCGSKRELPK